MVYDQNCNSPLSSIFIDQTFFFFSSYALSCGWMVLAYSWGTWNGACYYIEVDWEQLKKHPVIKNIWFEVFAERYRMKFIIKEEVGVSACATDDSEMDEEDEEEVSTLNFIISEVPFNRTIDRQTEPWF